MEGVFFKFRHGKNRKNLLLVDGGIRTHDAKTHDLSTKPFVKELKGIISSFDLLQKVTYCLPNLSLTTETNHVLLG